MLSVLFPLGLLLLGLTGCGATTCPPSASATSSPGVRAATVQGLDEAERRRAPNDSAEVRFLAQGDNAFVARLEMEPGAQVPEHQDATEEYIHILAGGGVMTIDGATYEVSAGETIFMPAGATVSFRNGDAPLVGLQVFAGPGPAARYDRWTRSEEPPLR